MYRDEWELANYLTAFYKLKLKKEMFEEALLSQKDEYYKWLNYLWVFKQNYYSRDFSQPKKDKMTMIDLFQIIDTMEVDNANKDDDDNIVKLKGNKWMRKICDWMLPGNENDNIMRALLQIKEDNLAYDYMGYYHTFMDETLFLFALQ